MDILLTVPNDCVDEVDVQFLQRMCNAMCVSFHKYGAVRDGFPGKIDALASARQRLREYHKTGNAENLVDAANFVMIESMAPAHPDAHYEPTDSDASPGRVQHDGGTTQRRNDQL